MSWRPDEARVGRRRRPSARRRADARSPGLDLQSRAGVRRARGRRPAVPPRDRASRGRRGARPQSRSTPALARRRLHRAQHHDAGSSGGRRAAGPGSRGPRATFRCRRGWAAAAPRLSPAFVLYDRLTGDAGGTCSSEATAFEGHPDNVAAALLGGLTAACVGVEGKVAGLVVAVAGRRAVRDGHAGRAREDGRRAARAAVRAVARGRGVQPSAGGAAAAGDSDRPDRRAVGSARAIGGISPIARRSSLDCRRRWR